MNVPLNREKEILLKISKGDESAFRELFTHYQPLLAGYIFRITESREMTEELVSDIFLKIWINRETLEGITHFKPYLFVISKNHAINALHKKISEWKRKRAWENENQHQALLEEAAVTEVVSPFNLIDEAIEHLTPRQREVYILHRHERLTYVEIADKLGIGRESVKTHLKMAVKGITAYIKLSIKASLIFLAVTGY